MQQAPFLSFALLAMAMALSGCGHDNPVRSAQYTLISNLDEADNGSLSLDSLHQASAAVGFRLPPADYQLNYVKLRLVMPLGSTSGVVFQLFDADTAGNPNQALTVLSTSSSLFSNAAQDFTLVPHTPTILHANQTYWIVGYCNVGPSVLGVQRRWICGSAVDGIATHAGSKYERYVAPNPPAADTTAVAKYAVVATHL